MKYLSVHFSKGNDNWSTPKNVYDELNKEFDFNDDPCPLNGAGGLDRPWGTRTFVNPPYSQIGAWVEKAYNEHLQGKTVVMLIPSRTDTRYWHSYIMQAKEIRFIKGRLKFGNAKSGAPFPSAIVVFDGRVQ